MANILVHFEIFADDTARAQKFYENVFGWAFQQVQGMPMEYILVYPGGEITQGPAAEGINGGLVQRPGPAPEDDKASPNAFACTVAVDDIESTLEKVTSNGGRIDMPTDDLPGVGRLAYVRDTEMNILGVLQPAPMG